MDIFDEIWEKVGAELRAAIFKVNFDRFERGYSGARGPNSEPQGKVWAGPQKGDQEAAGEWSIDWLTSWKIACSRKCNISHCLIYLFFLSSIDIVHEEFFPHLLGQSMISLKRFRVFAFSTVVWFALSIQSTDWLIDWLIDRSTAWLIDWIEFPNVFESQIGEEKHSYWNFEASETDKWQM